MSVVSFFPNAVGNSTNSFSFTMSDVIGDEWLDLAEQIFYDGNATAAIDVFCNAWVDDGTFSKHGVGEITSPHTTIWNHTMTKAIGWAIIIVLKTIFFEEKFDRWSGAYRFINLGSTLFPFTMAMWSIFVAMGEAGEGQIIKEEPISKTDVIMTLGKYVVNTPGVRNWLLTGVAWSVFRYTAFQKKKSSKTLSVIEWIEWIPGIMSGILSLLCWIFGETTIAASLLGRDLQPNTLLVYAKLIYWVSNINTGWYCYAGIVRSLLSTNRFTSFPCFLLVVFAGRIAMLWQTL